MAEKENNKKVRKVGLEPGTESRIRATAHDGSNKGMAEKRTANPVGLT